MGFPTSMLTGPVWLSAKFNPSRLVHSGAFSTYQITVADDWVGPRKCTWCLLGFLSKSGEKERCLVWISLLGWNKKYKPFNAYSKKRIQRIQKHLFDKKNTCVLIITPRYFMHFMRSKPISYSIHWGKHCGDWTLIGHLQMEGQSIEHFINAFRIDIFVMSGDPY